ncbi:WWE domain-containing protein [Dirofilaria immitis]|nr:WWE domain-containing protein [Dirofilaria immitis]
MGKPVVEFDNSSRQQQIEKMMNAQSATKNLHTKPNYLTVDTTKTIIPATSAESVGIVAENIDSLRENADKVQWFYGARHGGWWRYECRHENEIEKAYQNGLHTIELLIAGSLFCINFDSMCQYKKDLGRRSEFTRPVKRIERGDCSLVGTVRGIAGLRTPIELNTNVEQDISENLESVAKNLSFLNFNGD